MYNFFLVVHNSVDNLAILLSGSQFFAFIFFWHTIYGSGHDLQEPKRITFIPVR